MLDLALQLLAGRGEVEADDHHQRGQRRGDHDGPDHALATPAKRHGLAPPAPGEQAEHREREHQRSEEHTSELQSLMRISYAVFCLKKKNIKTTQTKTEIP